MRAYLAKPFLTEETIDFGLTKVYQRQDKKITISNPSDKPMKVQLFLAPDDLNNSQSLDSLIQKYSR